MIPVLIRELTSADAKAICHIHRNCDDPWHDDAECEAWLSKRLERGFYLQAAVYEGNVVGHGEWIVSDEPDEKYLYLGMLQVDSDCQKKGIGRTMIADGIRHAAATGCSTIKTIPDMDTGSEAFYSKCGFRQTRFIKSCTIPVSEDDFGDTGGHLIDTVPFSVIRDKKFLFGLVQPSSRHMWETANAKPDTDDRITPALLVDEGYIQLSYFPGDDTGLVLCWNNPEYAARAVRSALSLGYRYGLQHIRFIFDEKYSFLFDRYNTEAECNEITLDIP